MKESSSIKAPLYHPVKSNIRRVYIYLCCIIPITAVALASYYGHKDGNYTEIDETILIVSFFITLFPTSLLILSLSRYNEKDKWKGGAVSFHDNRVEIVKKCKENVIYKKSINAISYMLNYESYDYEGADKPMKRKILRINDKSFNVITYNETDERIKLFLLTHYEEKLDNKNFL